MSRPPSEQEREQVASELQRVREGVRERALLERPPSEVLPPARPLRAPQAVPSEREPAPPPTPERPDAGPLNRLWRTAEAGAAGLVRLLRRLLRPLLAAQQEFNARQVEFDNRLLDYIDARFDRTHHHYDGVLGIHGRHLGEVDERHLILQEELVAHVHDLVRRIDLVLSEAERGRVGLELALRDVKARLQRLEERLGRE